MPQSQTKVLFLCTGNSARSQMAEAFLRHHAGDAYDVHSAGMDPKGINPFTRRVMAEVGLDLAGQTSKSIDEYLGYVNFGWLITVCGHADANCPKTFLGVSNRAYWDDLEDPAAFKGSDEETMQVFRESRDQIEKHVLTWIAEQEAAAVSAEVLS